MDGSEENTLVKQLKDYIQTKPFPTEGYAARRQQLAFSPVSEDDLALAEAQLGFMLPLFLRRIYLEVGNGGFGPGGGLFPLNKQEGFSTYDNDLVTAYLGMRSMTQEDIDEHWMDEEDKPILWPEQVLMICDWGCNISTCLDCFSPHLPVFLMDANESMNKWAIDEDTPSLYLWLKGWMEVKPIFKFNWQLAKKVSVASLGKKV